MKRRGLALILLIILGAGAYYWYTQGFTRPAWTYSLFSTRDGKTAADVKTALKLSKRLSPFNISVEAKDGVVTLGGQVPAEDLKSLAGEITRDVEGVNEVRNEIVAAAGGQPPSGDAKVEDLEIRATILQSIARSPELGGKPIDVAVAGRVVTLTGRVDTPAQRSGAEQAARAVDGVAGVTNNLEVANPQAVAEPPAAESASGDPNEELARRVKFELFNTEAFDLSGITVQSQDGNVTLAGRVRSRAESLLAERVAQSVPGAKKVTNQLQVAAAAPRK